MKTLIITEKSSVARTYGQVLGVKGKNEGYIENDDYVITWAVGHLVAMSYPEVYDPALKKWEMEQLPFIPDVYKYEVISTVKKQFNVVKKLLNRKDIGTILYAGDSAREGLYIQMLIRQEAGHNPKAEEKIVWIDSQTEDEIKRGIKEAKDIRSYENMADAGYARAIEDYLTGLNFSRALSIKYGRDVNKKAGTNKYVAVAVGRVMTTVLGLIVEREQEINSFVETPYYGIEAKVLNTDLSWKAVEESEYYDSPLLYNPSGFKAKEDAENLIAKMRSTNTMHIESIDKIRETKYAPTLFNLAELQSECSKIFKISPDQTLEVVQSLYEKKLTTYPRTDARVLTSAVARQIDKVIFSLLKVEEIKEDAKAVIEAGSISKNVSLKKYVDDSKVSDHYAIIPTGEGYSALSGLSDMEKDILILISKRFLSAFMPPAEFDKYTVTGSNEGEYFHTGATILSEEGFYKVAGYTNEKDTSNIEAFLKTARAGETYDAAFSIKEGKTSPPKRYTSGSIILAMENAGKLIEEEELREQIRSCGIGTSATRGEIIKKLVTKEYISLNKKTQILTPAPFGLAVYDVVKETVPDLLSPKITANWEMGLQAIQRGEITKERYLSKLADYIKSIVQGI